MLLFRQQMVIKTNAPQSTVSFLSDGPQRMRMEETGLFISLCWPLGRPWWGLGRRAQRWVSVWGGGQTTHCQHFDNYLLSAALRLSLKNRAGALKPPRSAGERARDSDGDNPNFKWSLVPSPRSPAGLPLLLSATDNSPSSQPERVQTALQVVVSLPVLQRTAAPSAETFLLLSDFESKHSASSVLLVEAAASRRETLHVEVSRPGMWVEL